MSMAEHNLRHTKRVKRNFCLDEDADVLLRRYCQPGQKSHGRFVSRLIYEHHARREEWAQLAAAPVGCFVDDATHALDGAPGD
jgi:hypothetical protein